MAKDGATVAKDDGLRELLAKLVPEGETEVRDVEGRVHRLPASIPARRSVEVVRIVQRLLARPGMQAAASTIGRLGKGGAAEGMAMSIGNMVALAGDPEVLDDVEAAFAAAFPDALAALAGRKPADAFALEELVAAILPLFAGPVRRTLVLIDRAGAALPNRSHGA